MTQRLIDWYLIGHSSPVTEDRRTDWNIKTEGWSGFVKKYIEPALSWGADAIMLHNPFGALPGIDMEFDQFQQAATAGLTWLTGGPIGKGFVDAWKPITKQREVIAYLGKHQGWTRFSRFLTYPMRGYWINRWYNAIRPILDAGMSIGFDASSGLTEADPECRAIQLIKSLGVPCYIEARPSKFAKQWWNYPVVSIDTWWHRSDPAVYQDAVPWAARNEDLTGEIMLLINAPREGHTWQDLGAWYPAAIKENLSGGHSATISVSTLTKLGVTRRDLLP